MTLQTTYQIIAAGLCLTILLGMGMPSGLHAKTMDHCDEMSAMHDMNHSDSSEMTDMDMDDNCPMNSMNTKTKASSGDCEIMAFCACDVEQPPLTTPSPVQLKIKVPVSLLTGTVLLNDVSIPNRTFIPASLSNAYSPPPLFLANESFLI